jgi:hypothetical protein
VVREILAWDDCAVAVEFAVAGWAEVVGGLLGAFLSPIPGEEP